MDNALQSILELSRDPVFVISDGGIVMMNAAAKRDFPDRRVGDRAAEFLPEPILFEASDAFLSSAVLRGVRYTVSAQRSEGRLYLSLVPDAPTSALRGCMSDALMSGMLSELFNIGLSADRLRVCGAQDAPEREKYFGTLYRNYYALYRRLSNLNAVCALSEGSMDVVLRHADLVTLCGELVSSLSLLLGDAYARVEFVTELETLPACVDTQKVERLLLNLLSNSLKHTPKDGRVRLHLASNSANALLTVDDNGSGIAPAQLKSVFQSFRNRLDSESLTGIGSGGLGLGLCSIIAEKHGGTLILESREGEGTTVRVLLPLNPPGAGSLLAEPPVYTNGGETLLLTELSELLDAGAYRRGFPD